MKTYIPLDRLKRSRDSGSALYNMHPTDVLGRAGGGKKGKKRGICSVVLKNVLTLHPKMIVYNHPKDCI